MPTKTFHPNSILLPIQDVCTAKPNEDYASLRRQFFAMRNLLNAKNAYLHEYHKKDYELATLEAKGNIKSLDSERDMNNLLTEENIRLSESVESMTQEIDALKRIVCNTIASRKNVRQTSS